MKIRQGDTELIFDQVERCEDIDDLKAILDRNSEYHQNWKEFITAVIEVNQLSYEKLGRLCNCSKNTVKRWCQEGKLPQNRETFIKIALGIGLNLEQTNDFLQRYGKYPKLYSKNIEDAILIYVITHPDDTRDPFEYYQSLKQDCIKLINNKEEKEAYPSGDRYHTHILQDEITHKDTQQDFEHFLAMNCGAFQKSYSSLIEYIDLFILSKNNNIHEFVKYKNLNPVFDQQLSMLRNKREVPNRTKLIALGVHLNMSLEQLNQMLKLAYMEPLCAKDKVECTVIYAIESAHLNNPGYEYENAVYLKHYTQNLELQKRCQKVIADYWDTKTYEHIGEATELKAMEEEISEYLKWVLQEIEFDTDELFTLL